MWLALKSRSLSNSLEIGTMNRNIALLICTLGYILANVLAFMVPGRVLLLPFLFTFVAPVIAIVWGCCLHFALGVRFHPLLLAFCFLAIFLAAFVSFMTYYEIIASV
jgi:hypothetical protein